jgi:hypothetical protein
MSDEQIKLVMVKVLDPAAAKYEPYHREELSRAQEGEALGYWKIVSESEEKVVLEEARRKLRGE